MLSLPHLRDVGPPLCASQEACGCRPDFLAPLAGVSNYSVESDLLRDSVQVPSVGDALQLMLAGIVEDEAGAGDKVLHRLRDQYL